MDVYLFGTGASAPYGAPTMTGFLPEAFAPWTLIPREVADIDKELRIVAKAIDERCGIDLATVLSQGNIGSVVLEKVNVEELLALADETEDENLRKALDRVIYRTLKRSLEQAMDQRNPDGEYEMLISQLVASGKEVCLISFNYDLLLDRALVDAVRAQKVSWSYGLSFYAGIENFPSYPNVENPHIYLLKLHGSLNWRQCESENCGGLRLYYSEKYDTHPTWPPCGSCTGTRFKPVLVAPTPMKHFPRPLEDAWVKAADSLKKAETLTVIGYSFPVFDQKARNLFLKNFIVPNLYSNPRPKLTIVIRDECVRKAIKAWFLPAVDKRIEEYCSFEEYCAVRKKSLTGH